VRFRVFALRRGVAHARNLTAHAIPRAFAVEMTPAGGRFLDLGRIGAGDAVEYDLSRAPLAAKARTVAALEKEIHAALLGEGLFADEATAMVRTWSATWFGAEGTRVVFLLPRADIDAMIPLAIEPKPDAVVRVMVGRVEYLTPESEADLALELRRHAGGDPSAIRELARRGRFLEAAVRAVAASGEDPNVRAGADAVLRAYESILPAWDSE